MFLISKFLALSFLMWLLSTSPSNNSFKAELDSLPFLIPDENISPLRSLLDKDLQKRLEKRLKKNKTWSKLIKKKFMAVGIVDLSNPYNPKFARVNGDEMMYAASLPKLAVLLAISQSLEDSTMSETEEIREDMRQMISRSDNEAATRLIDRIGLVKINEILEDPKYELYDEDLGGGLWVGKRYARKGKRIGDPIHNISHGATVTQVCRFYYLLAMGKLVNRERSEQMLEYLADPELHHKFVNSLNKLVPDAKIFRKSGTWSDYHADSALVWGPKWRRYIVVGLIDNPRGEQILRDLIPAVEEVLKGADKTKEKK
jgi:beta-lactamase class A